MTRRGLRLYPSLGAVYCIVPTTRVRIVMQLSIIDQDTAKARGLKRLTLEPHLRRLRGNSTITEWE